MREQSADERNGLAGARVGAAENRAQAIARRMQGVDFCRQGFFRCPQGADFCRRATRGCAQGNRNRAQRSELRREGICERMVRIGVAEQAAEVRPQGKRLCRQAKKTRPQGKIIRSRVSCSVSEIRPSRIEGTRPSRTAASACDARAERNFAPLAPRRWYSLVVRIVRALSGKAPLPEGVRPETLKERVPSLQARR